MLEIFDEFDADAKGSVTWDELREGLLERGIPIELIEVFTQLCEFFFYEYFLYFFLIKGSF